MHDQLEEGEKEEPNRVENKGKKEITQSTIFKTILVHYREAMEYQSYQLLNTSILYDSKVAGKVSRYMKKLRVTLELTELDPEDVIFILATLRRLKPAFDVVDLHEGGAVRCCLKRDFSRLPKRGTTRRED